MGIAPSFGWLAPPDAGPVAAPAASPEGCENGRASRLPRLGGYSARCACRRGGRPRGVKLAIGKFVGCFALFGVTYTHDCLPNRARGRHDGSLRAQVGRRAIAAGRLRAFQPTNKLLIREDDACAWIEDRLVSLTGSAPSLRPGASRRRPLLGSQRPGSVDDLREVERKAVRA